MTEESTTVSLRRSVNIESAIDKSSFQVPVFVAISAEGGEAQVIKTFATAREVFEHVFSILLDRLLQRRAVEAVANLVPQPGDVTSSRDTEYVLLVRGKAIFWFSGAAAKRAAGRRLLLEHARDLAKAEQTPFYVLNSRTKKIRAAILMASIFVAILIGFFLKPFAVRWSREPTRSQNIATSNAAFARDHNLDVPKSVTASEVEATSAEPDRGVDLSSDAPTASQYGRRNSVFDPTSVEAKNRAIIWKYEDRMAKLTRAWPNQFHGDQSSARSEGEAEVRIPKPTLPSISKTPLTMATHIRGLDKPTK